MRIVYENPLDEVTDNSDRDFSIFNESNGVNYRSDRIYKNATDLYNVYKKFK